MKSLTWQHVALAGLALTFTLAIVALLLKHGASLPVSLVPIGAFITTLGALFTKQIGGSDASK